MTWSTHIAMLYEQKGINNEAQAYDGHDTLFPLQLSTYVIWIYMRWPVSTMTYFPADGESLAFLILL